ncbi:MAG: Elongation factor 1-beta [Methanomicrobiales archaeon 53_19]|nr:MAG: Elongation factor 1-beta [Methanomicrobiales archaeon 53_19]
MWFSGAVNMGSVAVILKVMPESTDVDLEVLKQAIREKIPGGATEGIESQFNDIPGIDRAEIIDLSRMI